MTTVWNPNLLTVAGLIIMACGLGLLGKALLSAVSAVTASAPRAAAKARVDLSFAAPMLLAGLFVLASAQFVSSSLNPLITSLLLAAAFALLLYAMIEDSIVERLANAPAEATGKTLKLIAPPVMAASAPAPEITAAPTEATPADAIPPQVASKA